MFWKSCSTIPGTGVGKTLKFYIEDFYVMSMVLSGELSYTQTDFAVCRLSGSQLLKEKVCSSRKIFFP